MSYRKKQPLPLSFNHTDMTSQLFVQPDSDNSSEISLSPRQTNSNVYMDSVDYIPDPPAADTTNSTFMPEKQGGLHVAPNDRHAFTPLESRPKPLLSNTFGYSFNSRPSDIQAGSSAANANLSSIFLSISPTAIADTCLTRSPSPQVGAFPNSHDYRNPSHTATLNRTRSGPLSETRNSSVKEINIFDYITKEKHDCIDHSLPVTPSSNASGAPSYYSHSSQFSTSTLATSHLKDFKESALINHQASFFTCSSPLEHRTTYDQMDSSVSSSKPANLNGLTPSSSFASTLSLTSASDLNLKFRPRDLLTSWPIPPSSFNSSVRPDGPRKAATYYPLRSILSKPAGYPVNPMQTQSSSTLAYLDLSSVPRAHQLVPDESNQVTPAPKSNRKQPFPHVVPALKRERPSMKFRSATMSDLRSSQISIQSDISESSVYEDALEKTEWMETDNGDAYDDLEKTQASARRISQSLTLMNDLGAINRTAKRQMEQLFQLPLPKGQSQDSASRTFATPIVRSNYSLPTSRQVHPPAQRADRQSDELQFLSRSPPAMDHHDDEFNVSRSRNEAEQFLVGGVPLFTRMTLMREDREDEKFPLRNSRKDQPPRVDEDELRPIQEMPDSANSESNSTSKSTLPSSGRRRLKPLILRPSTPIVNSSRKRASTPSSKFLSLQSSSDCTTPSESSSPPRPFAQSDMSHTSHDSMPNFSSHPSPSFRRRVKSSSDQSTRPGGKKLSSEMSINHFNEVPLSTSKVSSLNSSIKDSESNSELLVIVNPNRMDDLTSSNLNEPIKHADKTGSDGLSTLLEDVTNNTSQTMAYMHPDERSSTVVSFRNHGSSKAFNMDNSVSNRLAERQSVSTLNLPTLAAGSSKVTWSHTTTNKVHTPSPRKRHIHNIFVPRQSPVDSKDSTPKSNGHSSIPFTKSSLDSPSSQGSSMFQQSTRKEEDYLKGTTSSPACKAKSRMWSNNRLTVTLTRMEAQEGKLLDLTSINKENPRAFFKAKDEKKLVKGKLKRISQPILLSGEEERLALWGMISSNKITSPHHQLR